MAKESNTSFIGKCNFRGNERVFGIKGNDRRQHVYVIGKTGTGKTTLLKNLVLQDIRAGRGLGIIDPHGEFVEEVLAQIPPERVKDVIYFNPVDSEFPIGFNVLEVPDQRYKHLIVSDLLGIFTKIWANVWSARMEYILQNCIMALLDTPGTTLLGIPRILVDKDYRQKIVANVKDPVVRSFWIHEYETWRDQFRNEAIVPIQNKVNQFLNTSFIRNIVGQAQSSLHIPEIMNEGKILLVNVSKGKVGEDNSALLGAMIITKIQLAAMERVRIPEEDRNDFYLYVDEFQNFATDSFASILSEARKYRLNLTLAHQYIGQLVTDVSTKVRDAVFGNVGTMIAFRVGATDGEFLEQEFSPEFMIQDLINLPNHHIYLKLMVDGITSRSFSAVTLSPLKYETDPTVSSKIIQFSRDHYGRPRAEVEEKIQRWSGMTSDATSMGEEENKLTDAICWNCGKTATVPFKPDGKRPVYCLDCLKKIEAGMLIPLPERMPQLGTRVRFDATLGDIGIEFGVSGGARAPASSGSVATRQSTPSRDFSSSRSGGGSDRGGFRPQHHAQERYPLRKESYHGGSNPPPLFQERRPLSGESRGGDGRLPQRSTGLNQGGGDRRNNFSGRRDDPRGDRGPQQTSRGFHSEPIVRVPQEGVRPVSLSSLKQKDAESHELPRSSGVGQKKQGEERSVDILGLRKALDEALGEEKEKIIEKKNQEKNPDKVIRPGDTIKF